MVIRGSPGVDQVRDDGSGGRSDSFDLCQPAAMDQLRRRIGTGEQGRRSMAVSFRLVGALTFEEQKESDFFQDARDFPLIHGFHPHLLSFTVVQARLSILLPHPMRMS
jgi:hypothetical protein